MPFQPMPPVKPGSPPTIQVPTQRMTRVSPSAGYQRAPKRSKGTPPWVGLVLLVIIVLAISAAWLYGTRPKVASSGQTGAVGAQVVQVQGNGDDSIESVIQRWWNESTADAHETMCWNVAHDWLEAWASIRWLDTNVAGRADSEERAMVELGRLCGVTPEPYFEEECGC